MSRTCGIELARPGPAQPGPPRPPSLVSCRARYKAFLDTFWRKKSLVDTIFMVGHWNEETRRAYCNDLPLPWLRDDLTIEGAGAPADNPATAGGAVASRAAALAARRKLRSLLRRQARHELSNQEPGPCEQCTWRTEWSRAGEKRRVRCVICHKKVCSWCIVPDCIICMECHLAHGKERWEPPDDIAEAVRFDRDRPARECESCTATTQWIETLLPRVGGSFPDAARDAAGGSTDSIAALNLMQCHRCNRWLCTQCRQAQLPVACVVCPVLHPPDPMTLKQVLTAPSRRELEEARKKADDLTQSRGRGRLSTGAYTHQADIDGRAARVTQHLGKRARTWSERSTD